MAARQGYLGSISHKDRAGVGIVAKDTSFSSPDDPPKVGIGVDLERTANSRRNIARRVLTEGEVEALGKIEVCMGLDYLLVSFLSLTKRSCSLD